MMTKDEDGTFSCQECRTADSAGLTEQEAAAHLYRKHPDFATYVSQVEMVKVPAGQTPRPRHVAPNRAQRRERISRRGGRS